MHRFLTFTLVLLTALFLPAAIAAETAVTFSENFDGITAGTSASPQEAELSSGGSADGTVLGKIPSGLTNDLEWKGRGIHAAGGALAILHFEQRDWFGTESVQGILQSPMMDVRMDDGSFTLRLTVRPVDPEAADRLVHIELYDPYTTNSIDAGAFTLPASPAWSTIEVTLRHPGFGNHLAYVQMASEGADWLLDKFEIVQNYSGLMAPVIHYAKDVTYERFTAHWNALPLAKEYLVDVFSLNRSGERQYLLRDKSTSATSLTVDGTVKGTQYYYTVRGRNDRYTSEEAEPRAVNVPLTSMETPVALPATDITPSSFTAAWEPTLRAMGYIVELFGQFTADTHGTYAVLEEDFHLAPGYADYPDFPAPYYGKMDEITSTPGWTVGDWAVTLPGVFGLDCYWSTYEKITLGLPEIDLSTATGGFILSLDIVGAKGARIICTSGDEKQEVSLAGGREIFNIEFSKGTAATCISLEIKNTRDVVYFHNISVLQKVQPGDVLTERLGTTRVEAPATSTTFTDLTPKTGQTYAYHVKAWSHSFSEDGIWGPDVFSEPSEKIYVKLTTSSMSDIEKSESVDAEYFDLRGIRIPAANLTPGLYIRRMGGKTDKVIIR